jgi:hypothetical protein
MTSVQVNSLAGTIWVLGADAAQTAVRTMTATSGKQRRHRNEDLSGGIGTVMSASRGAASAIPIKKQIEQIAAIGRHLVPWH